VCVKPWTAAAVALLFLTSPLAPQQPPAPPSPQGQAQGQEPAPPATGRPQGREREGQPADRQGQDDQGRSGGRRRPRGDGGEDAQGPGQGGDGQDPENVRPVKKEPRRGIPVDDLMVRTHCSRCHQRDDKGMMTRISYARMSPEGWSETVKRMIRLFDVKLSPADAKQIVRYLANEHGLTRSEAERSLYESERRVHWSEDSHDQDFRRACAQCHTLGRVLMQARDDEEWQLLRATHVAMFPLARGQMGGGPPQDDEMRRFRGVIPGGGGANTGGGTNAGGGASNTGGGGSNSGGGNAGGAGRGSGGMGDNVGDRVLAKLAKDQPLFTAEWDRWVANRREVPLQGTWTVTGHEIGRGDVLGTAEIKRVDADEYEVHWQLAWSNGDHLERNGRGLLYGGYSWRGRSTDPGDQSLTWREVLLLDDQWQHLKGRCFTGDYDEIGMDLELHRHVGAPHVLALRQRAVTVPALGHVLEVIGESFPANVAANDFYCGSGVTVRAAERVSERLVRLTLDVAADATCGPRFVAFGAEPGRVTLQLYDQIDYVRVTPVQGLARTGGGHHPKQFERFEAIAVHRGKDNKPFTDDDVDMFAVQPRWSLAEFAVRDDDDDIQYVGALDPVTGRFTPNIDGPNPRRKWQANNIGDVLVTAEVELETPIRPPDPKPVEEPPPADKPAERSAEHQAEHQDGGDPPPHSPGPGEQQPQQSAAPPPAAVKPAAAPIEDPSPRAPKTERRTFRARAHLIVTVPLFARWNALEWEDR